MQMRLRRLRSGREIRRRGIIEMGLRLQVIYQNKNTTRGSARPGGGMRFCGGYSL